VPGIRNIRSHLSDERGTAIVEFAIVLPVLALVLFGITDFGRIMNYWNDENQMAAAGARSAAVNYQPPSGTLQSYIQSQADTGELRNGTGAVTQKATVTIITTGNVGDPVTVCVTSKFRPFRILGIGPSITTHGSATMRVEQAATSYMPDSSTGSC
jgi:Flp pilus assembly protein TadG